MEPVNHKIEYFLFSESFQRYVLKKHPVDIKYWEAWALKHPEALGVMESAKEALTFIVARGIKPENETVREEVFKTIKGKINSEKGFYNGHPGFIRIKHFWYAASLLLIISCSIFLLRPVKKQYTSKFAGQYLEVIVPKGQRSQLLLPDGTKVWLNSGSIFRYPIEFLKQGRNVYLEGEAFFDVKHDNNVPFFVHLKEKLMIKVLGTEFNVKCYDNEKIIETTLVKGLIKLSKERSSDLKFKEIELRPNEKAVFQKMDQSLNISKLLPEGKDNASKANESVIHGQYIEKLAPITAWKEDQLIFCNETFAEIAIKMERWYGLKITILDNRLKGERFTGKFVNKETIYQVLDIFNRTEPIHYSTENKEIIITKRNTNY